MTGDLQASKVRQGLEKVLAEFVYEAYRLGKYGTQEYLPMWHEAESQEHLPTVEIHRAIEAAHAWHLEQVHQHLTGLLDESRDDIAQACGDPGSFVERNVDESLSRWSARAVEVAIKQRLGATS